MGKNLTYQMCSSIDNAFRPNMDKHSNKAQGNNNDYKIYSYASRKSMIDFAHRFGRYMKENYHDIKQVKQITIEHINSYLQARESITQKTMQHEIACINKMQLCVNKKFGIDVDWKNGRSTPQPKIEKLRNAIFSQKQIEGLNRYLDTKRDCHSKNAVYLGERFALRASEITKLQARDILWDKDLLHIHDSKGKRSRDISITNDDKIFLKELVGDKKGSERLIPLRSDSICCYLNRCCKVLGYSNIVNSKTSFHSLRKYSISNYYQQQKEKYGDKVAREKSMLRLGHSENRKDLFDTYIKKM